MADGELVSGLQVVEELARRFQAGDYERAFELYHPEVLIEQPASLPHGGIHRGVAGVRAMGALFARFWDRAISEPKRYACDNGGVVQISTQVWTGKTTGRRAEVDVVELISVEAGRVTEIRVFQQDTQRLLATLDRPGAVPVQYWSRISGVTAVDATIVESLVRHWDEGWNKEDVDMVVAPFAEDIVFSSPFVPRITKDPSVCALHGLSAVRQYVAESFVRATRGIRYTVDAAYAGTDTVALAYTVHHPTYGDRGGVDTMRLGQAGKVVEWRCQYAFES